MRELFASKATPEPRMRGNGRVLRTTRFYAEAILGRGTQDHVLGFFLRKVLSEQHHPFDNETRTESSFRRRKDTPTEPVS